MKVHPGDIVIIINDPVKNKYRIISYTNQVISKNPYVRR